MLPCLDIQLWIDEEGMILHKFYSIPMTNPYLILQRSAVSPQVKRTTIFEESMRRLRNCSPELDWDTKAEILTKFAWQMYISGYDEKFRTSIITGSINMYQQMIKDDQEGSKPLYRTKQQIIEHRKTQKGNSSSSWFLRGEVRQVLMVPPTPGAKLKQVIQNKIGNMIGPDEGKTKVVERGGIPILTGLQKKDPFKSEGCDFGDPECLVGAGCMKTGVCYRISCNECDPKPTRVQGVQ